MTPLLPCAAARAVATLIVSALLVSALGGCGTVARRAPGVERAPDAQAGTAPRPGGYYKDDGPGDNPPANLDAIADAQPRVEPLHRFANNPYNVLGQDYVPLRQLQTYRERGIGSWYGRKFHGQRTSSGESYDMYAMTAAHPVLPIPSYARVTNPSNGRSVVVRINDRGPFRPGRVIDLSYTAAWKLGYASNGSTLVEVEAVTPEEFSALASRRAPSEPRADPAADVRPVSPAAAPLGQPLGAPDATPAASPAIPVTAHAGGVYLQLGAFSARENAENFRARINSQLAWLDRAIEILQREGLFRLHLGPYRDRAEAGGIAERIREALDLKAVFVTR
jgi:rare lipoprotein A